MYPGDPDPTPDEGELFLNWLSFLRAAVVSRLDGLDEDQARWRPDGDKLIALLGIVNHLAHVEWRWIDGVFLGAKVSRREEEFTVARETSIADVVAHYERSAARTAEVVRAAPSLSAPCVRKGEQQVDLRWVLIHLVEETARHAGHADATREFLDGTTGDE